jgi:glycosyltransferase involved in cell wall biosynthesis
MISVLVPARNCADWISAALRSVAEQTAAPSQILVADDGSDDGTVDRIRETGIPGLELLSASGRLGISAQMNRLLERAEGRYIARMDGDDISLPRRFERELALMERRSLSVVGSWTRRFGRSNTLHTYPAADGELKAGLAFGTPFCNPSSVMDRDRWNGKVPRYDESWLAAGDYRYWTDRRNDGSWGNVQEVLVLWRMHDRNVGTDPAMGALQRANAGRIRDDLLRDWNLELEAPVRSALEARALGATLDLAGNAAFLQALLSLASVSRESLSATGAERRKVLVAQWDLACLFAAWSTPGLPQLWWEGRRALGSLPSPRTAAKIAVKRLLGSFKGSG